MFFVLSKVLGFFALPSNVIAVAGLLGVVLMATRLRRLGRIMAAASLVLLAVVGILPLGNLLLLPLEERFPPWDPSRGAPDGIIVLGGSIDPEVSAIHGTAALNESAERLTEAVALTRKYPAARLVFSGGDANLLFRHGAEADFALALLEDLGVPRERVLLEDRSRNTVENAIFTKALVKPKPDERWLLVTSAYHMPRAIGAFRAAAFPVEAYPVDWRTRGAAGATALTFISVADGLKRTDTALREWIGLAAYRLSHRTSALFPGPE
jgi:uncharacterized SAM-binding protein YcdF (DUF218 family)